ncbi:MAG: adenylate kinase [Candidatus Doudnabacteria bacterium]|nr:adenylate kinase [Candidatus Doudnabacteria bacterium]
MFDLILLGDPAAGKATQAKLLCKKYGFYDLDMGKELRKLDKSTKNPKLKHAFSKTLNKGKLTPTKIVREILKNKIYSVPAKRGILFDGTPKMIGEAKLVSKWLKDAKRAEKNILVLYLKIPQQEVLQRMSSRKEYFKGKFTKRVDDNATALKNRVAYYKKNISEVLEFFGNKYVSKTISGIGTEKEVFNRIEKQIYEFNAKNQTRNR